MELVRLMGCYSHTQLFAESSRVLDGWSQTGTANCSQTILLSLENLGWYSNRAPLTHNTILEKGTSGTGNPLFPKLFLFFSKFCSRLRR